MPCDGKITKVNDTLAEEPQAVSINAEVEGWLCEVQIDDVEQLKELLDEESYKAYVESLDEDEH